MDVNMVAFAVMMIRSVLGFVVLRAPGLIGNSSDHGCEEGGCVLVNMVTSAWNHQYGRADAWLCGSQFVMRARTDIRTLDS